MGAAGPALLDTYEAERRPVAEHTARRSADPTGGARATEQEVHVDIGGRIPHVWSDALLVRLDGKPAGVLQPVANRHPRGGLESPRSPPDFSPSVTEVDLAQPCVKLGCACRVTRGPIPAGMLLVVRIGR